MSILYREMYNQVFKTGEALINHTKAKAVFDSPNLRELRIEQTVGIGHID